MIIILIHPNKQKFSLFVYWVDFNSVNKFILFDLVIFMNTN